MIDTQRLEAIYKDSIYDAQEFNKTQIMRDVTYIPGNNTEDILFITERLESHRDEVQEMVDRLHPSFGIGNSLLYMPILPNKMHWGNIDHCTMLMHLALALDIMEHVQARQPHSDFPDGIPVIKKVKKDVEDTALTYLDTISINRAYTMPKGHVVITPNYRVYAGGGQNIEAARVYHNAPEEPIERFIERILACIRQLKEAQESSNTVLTPFELRIIDELFTTVRMAIKITTDYRVAHYAGYDDTLEMMSLYHNESKDSFINRVINRLDELKASDPSIRRFIIATATGGLMETPEIEYEKFDVIEAHNSQQALSDYNKKHGCQYFYGKVILESKLSTDVIRRAITNSKDVNEIYVNLLKEYDALI